MTVSQLYPVRDVEEFTVAPIRSSRGVTSAAAEFPDTPWTDEDIARLAITVTNPTVLAALDLLSATPGRWVSLPTIREHAGRSREEARGDLAGLTIMIKHRFGRRNWPFEIRWAVGGEQTAHYRLASGLAEAWLRFRSQA